MKFSFTFVITNNFFTKYGSTKEYAIEPADREGLNIGKAILETKKNQYYTNTISRKSTIKVI